MLIIGGFGLGKTNALLDLIREEDSDALTEKIYLYVKDLNEPKYKLLIKKHEEALMCLDKLNPKAFIEYSNTMNDVYNNINDYNPKRGRKILIVFDDMIVDINTNKKFQAIVKKLFNRCRKLNYLLYLSHNLIFCSKKYQIKFYTLSNNEDT